MNTGILVILITGIALVACGLVNGDIRGSGNIVTKPLPISDFTRVEAGNSFNVTITRADRFNVSIQADDNLVEHLDVRKSGETLVLRLKPGKSARRATLVADVSLPHLNGVKLSGASRGVVSGFESEDKFDAKLSGASYLSGDIRIGHGDVELSGASSVDLKGAGTGLTLKGSGASTADLDDFTFDSAVVKLSGASTAQLNVRDNIGPVSLSGASRLVYSGDPAFRDFQTSGASSISAED